MNWTAEKPTKPGIYWCNYRARVTVDKVEATIEAVKVYEDDPGFIYFLGTEIEQSLEELKTAFFYGPIEPPPGWPIKT